MSRYVKKEQDGSTVAYGFDKALGYFIDVFGPEDEEGISQMIVEESSLFSGMSNGKMVELMQNYQLPEAHINLVMLDLEI
jgi:hypothetical protein